MEVQSACLFGPNKVKKKSRHSDQCAPLALHQSQPYKTPRDTPALQNSQRKNCRTIDLVAIQAISESAS